MSDSDVHRQTMRQVRVIRVGNRAGVDAAEDVAESWPAIRAAALDYAEDPRDENGLRLAIAAALLLAYREAEAGVARTVAGAAEAERRYQAGVIGAVPDSIDLSGPRVDGGTLPRNFARARAAHAEKLARSIIAGTRDGVPVRQIVADARKVNKTALRGVENLGRAEVLAAVGAARDQVFTKSDVIAGEVWLSILDSGTTPLCRANAGAVRKAGKAAWTRTNGSRYIGGPPGYAHFGCRSDAIPWFIDEKKPSVPTFAQFIAGISAAEKKEVLGPARYRKWRNGDIPLGEFVNERGRLLTLAELR